MSRNKPTVYVDTNILSYLHYRGADPLVMQNQRATRQWWREECPFFKLLASRTVENELADGDYPGQEKALAEARKLPYLALVPSVREVANKFVDAKVVPETKPGDALQLAFATVYRVDYLLSWNRAHLVSSETQGRLALFRAALGWWTPLIVSPDTIPQVALGESIRRRD